VAGIPTRAEPTLAATRSSWHDSRKTGAFARILGVVHDTPSPWSRSIRR
jgi:hypothetical protein